MLTQYGLMAGLAMAAMLLTAGLWCRRQRVPYGHIMGLCIAVIPCALLGSRLLFSVYALAVGDFTSPIQGLYLWDGGASLTGAIGGAIAGAAIAAKVTHVKPGVFLDGIALGMPLAILLMRIAEPLVNTDTWIYELGFGRPVDSEASYAGLFDAFNGQHPVFLYQAVTAVVLFAVGLLVARAAGKSRPGDTLLVFLTLYGATQMVFSSLNSGGNEHLVWYYIRFDQIAGLIMLLVAFILFTVRWGRGGAKGWQIALAAGLVLLGSIIGVRQEFAVDSDEPLLEYAIMIVSVALMAAVTLAVRRKSLK